MSQVWSRLKANFRDRWPAGLATCGIMFVTGAVSAFADDPVIARGLSHSSEGRDVAETAIERVNTILTGSGQGLAPAWLRSPRSPPAGETSTTPVYLIAAGEKASSTPAAVPRGCACIFVNIKMLNQWLVANSTGPGRMRLDVTDLLAFMLLHEVGHIATRSAGVEFASGEMSQLNIEPSIAKANEQKADQFATLIIADRMHRQPASLVSITAGSVSTALAVLSWNMQAYRTLDEFGASVTGKPEVFFDQNYSHPNLAWRILNANHMIHQTPQTKELLDAFEDARRRGANPEPLFVRPKDK